MRHIRFCALLTALPFLLATGCAGGGQYGPQRTNVRYYGDCYRPIAELRESENTVLKSTAGGAALGAVAGALLGLLAADRHHRGRGAAVGAAMGAALGGLAGNVHGRQQKIADENRRMAAYLEEIEGDISGLDIVESSSLTALQCYDRRFDQLTAAMQDRRISRGEAQERFHEIRTGREEAIAIMGRAERRGHELEQQYETAFYEEERALGPLEEDDPMMGAGVGEWEEPAWQESETWEAPRQGQVTTARTRKATRTPQAAQAKQTRQARASQTRTPQAAKATTRKTTRSTDSAKRRQARSTLAKAKQRKATLNQRVSKISEARQEAQTKSRADSKKMEQMMAVIDA